MLYKGGSAVRYLKFKANGEDNIKWFSKETLTSSYWNDLSRNTLLQGFFINGRWNKRSFDISKNYGGCRNDAGWLVITNSRSESCNWGKRNSGTNILYSNTMNWVKFRNRK